jgi:hypothetical protein
MATAPVREAMDGTTATRWAGLAGIGFGVSVIVQNLWAQSAGIDPAPDADATEIAAKFADNAGAHGLLAAWVALNLVLIGLFLAGTFARLARREPVLATLGLVGGILLMGFFAMLNVPRVALALGAEQWGDEPALVDALWDMHLATFAFAGIALGLALLGFSLAAVRLGLVPGWFRIVGPVGALFIIGANVPVQATADGSPITMVGMVGFVGWLVFLVVMGRRLWTETGAVDAPTSVVAAA